MKDLSNIVAAERSIEIKHPATDEPVGLSITLLPDSHPLVREAQRRTLNARLTGRGGKPTAEKMEQSRLEMLAASTGGWAWQGELTFHGEKPECTTENVRAVYKALPWVAEQVDAALGDRAAFFRGDEEPAS